MARKKFTEKEVHVQKFHGRARSRAKTKGIPFDITIEYLRSIAPDECPVFKTPFEWGSSGLGRGKFKDNAPQLDRIVPELGYVVGNVAFISHRANRIKDNGTMQEHYDIADWIWDKTHPEKDSIAPVPEGFDSPSEFHAYLGTLLAAGPREDCDGSHHHSGAIPREDTGDCTEESCGDCMGCGSEEMGTLTESDYFQNIRLTTAEIFSLLNRVGYLYRKFRECRMVDGTECEVSELSDRRELEIQGLLDKAVQSTKKAAQDLFSEVDPDWYAHPSKHI